MKDILDYHYIKKVLQITILMEYLEKVTAVKIYQIVMTASKYIIILVLLQKGGYLQSDIKKGDKYSTPLFADVNLYRLSDKVEVAEEETYQVFGTSRNDYEK